MSYSTHDDRCSSNHAQRPRDDATVDYARFCGAERAVTVVGRALCRSPVKRRAGTATSAAGWAASASQAERRIAGMLGVHFAITSEQERSLLTADDDGDQVGELLEDIEESWDDDASKVDTDKAWDAIHRCLTDGTLDPDDDGYPLSHAVLGGRHLDDDCYVVYVSAAEVHDVAEALRAVDRTWLRRRFDAIDHRDYDGAQDDEDFEYTWRNFVAVQAFYDRAATAERAVIFTAT
ncbi:YfbM family protein [Micromonospora sp. LOL_024]|uniref:YfbM family protein n=1 Tax=Micromonospora sp. LOL_024 TaxID=3345412 RepID=UPI003A841F2C